MWKIKTLSELTSFEFYELLLLRIDTFVVEQARIYHELDAFDKKAYHLFYQQSEGQPVSAYARVFKHDGQVTFGRVVTAKNLRGSGIGGQLVEKIISCCQNHWPDEPIIIESQEQVVKFYEKYGFEIISDTFILEGSPHVTMRYQ